MLVVRVQRRRKADVSRWQEKPLKEPALKLYDTLGEQFWSNLESTTAWEGGSRQRGNSKFIHSFHTGLLSAPDVTASFPPWFRGKESACNAGDTGDAGSIPGSGRSPGEGHGNPLWYSCLENPMDRGAWWATVHWIAESETWLMDWENGHDVTGTH